jgi:hypothetical protein
VNTIKAKTCPDAEARGLAIVEEVARQCDARHVAFDEAEQKRLVNHPFIKQILARQKKAVAEAGLSKKRKVVAN